MKKLKRDTLFALWHTSDEAAQAGSLEYFGLSELYWRLPDYRKSSVRQALLEMAEERMVVKLSRARNVYYRLGSVGREYLYSMLAWKREEKKLWDKGWRVVIIDSGALERAEVRKLRRGLKDMGLKPLSRGVWVTPLAITEILKRSIIEWGVAHGVVVLVTRRFVLGDDAAFAEKVWNLREKGRDYLHFISETKGLLRKVKGAKSLNERLKAEFLSVYDRWVVLIVDEPGLPKALLPEEWAFDEARKSFEKLANGVLELEREAS